MPFSSWRAGLVAVLLGSFWVARGVAARPQDSAVAWLAAREEKLRMVLAGQASEGVDETTLDIQQILQQVFDYEEMTRRIGKKTWAELSQRQRSRFVEAIRWHFQESASDQLRAIQIQAVQYGSEKKRPWGTLVEGRVRLADWQGDLKIYLGQRQGQWRIYDLAIDRFKLVEHYRKSYDKLLADYSPSAAVAELTDQDVILVEDFSDTELHHFPRFWEPWRGDKERAREVYTVQEESSNRYLHARDEGQSVIIRRTFKWNPKKYPYVRWRWRAWKLPPGGDERYGDRNDSAAGVYVVLAQNFLHIPRSLKYVWSTTLPVHSVTRRQGIGKPMVVVAESGSAHLGEWQTVTVNVYEDFKRLFGSEPPVRSVGIGILTDANTTKPPVEADYDDFMILKTP